MDLKTLWPTLKPLAKMLLDSILIPEIKKLEDTIGNEAVKQVVEAITAAVEGYGDSALS